MYCKPTIKFEGKNILLSSQLVDDLNRASNPQLVIVSGNGRTGKSTLANILVNPVLHPDRETFKTDEGNVPVTMDIQYVSMKLSDLLRIHKININPCPNSEIFILDCEGIDSLGDSTLMIRKAICSLFQISTVNLFVTKTLDRSNIYDLKSFFTLPQLIPGSHQQLYKSYAVVITNSGVPGRPSEEEFEQKRKENDAKQTDLFISHVNDKNIRISKENAALFAQPKWDRPNHYFESINDLIRFIAKSASKRIAIPGKNLVQIFNKCSPFISQINDLDNQDIRLEHVIDNLISSYFQQAMNSCEYLINNAVKDINNKSASELIDLSKKNYTYPFENNILASFAQNANGSFNNITNLFPEKYNRYRNDLQRKIKSSLNNAFSNRCQSILIPYVSKKVIDDKTYDIRHYFGNQTSYSLRSINDNNLADSYSSDAADSFYNQLHAVNASLTSGSEYVRHSNEIKSTIKNKVHSYYRDRCNECPPYPKSVYEARKAGQNGSIVTLYPPKAGRKSADFKVIGNDEVTIDGMKILFTNLITKDSLTNELERKSRYISAKVDIYNLTIIPEITRLTYREEGYRRKPKWLHHLHHRYYIDIIKITLPNPFYFLDGTQTYEIGSHGHNVDVPPISFKII
ncbi:hypothetical protein M9Y10_006728 [Tritrichomonas musculus]|uniref:Guanylate-binding protein N-terminal domain-containing protein n=1 Tax=Tritrichomonas musculus TaxID=1915356 RepID=A0ABR2JEY7_9EUKA